MAEMAVHEEIFSPILCLTDWTGQRNSPAGRLPVRVAAMTGVAHDFRSARLHDDFLTSKATDIAVVQQGMDITGGEKKGQSIYRKFNRDVFGQVGNNPCA